MRFLHTADWHIGKKLHGYDLLEDQKKSMKDILAIAQDEKVDAIVIAGDLYDRSVPSVEAVEVFNQQIIEMNLEAKFPILAISGNHDSSTRLEAGAPWFSQTNFHLYTRLEQAFTPIEWEDTQFFLLPYFEPIAARLYFEDESIRTLQQAMERVIAAMKELFSPDKKQVLVSHFFVAGSEKSDSETKIEVGGLDGVPGSLLTDFDYVALGHLHGKDALHQENARYSGSPLKFSLSELNQEKGVWLIETEPTVSYRFVPLTPLHEMVAVTAEFNELISPDFYQNIEREDYLQIRLLDRAIIPNMMNQLRQIYPHILSVERVNGREEGSKRQTNLQQKKLNPSELIATFFEEMTEEQLTDQQQVWVAEALQNLNELERRK
ncbi:exonuclease sbcCD subunit D [Enterococcus sp. JM4C]|uniref:exonuclease SbcCD subunit D n=1 Tax=Candidatus Enterococcus huntleyi TaxID=1857217 RepID=UPI00137A8C2B|nr:exonuclease SbcCD subunit D [Enterococcus sp. JM4C]KAF1296383.1 exonuclease sbcCD subunit D [Enterococcus sp. JM4C]